jgi:hypothetical protein
MDQGIHPDEPVEVQFNQVTRFQNATEPECIIPKAQVVFLPAQKYRYRRALPWQKFEPRQEAAPMDLVVLKLNVAAKAALKFDYSPPQPSEAISYAGYPVWLGESPETTPLESFNDKSIFFANDRVRCLTDQGFLSCVSTGPGASGSPTLNKNGDVIGLVIGRSEEKMGTQRAVQHVDLSPLPQSVCENLMARYNPDHLD